MFRQCDVTDDANIVEDSHSADTSGGLREYISSYEGNHSTKGVTLAQLVKASVGQADVQRFEPHLGHNLLSCGVFLVKSLWAPSGTNHKAKLASSLSGWLGRYTNMEYLQSLCLKRRGQLLFPV